MTMELHTKNAKKQRPQRILKSCLPKIGPRGNDLSKIIFSETLVNS